MKQTGKKIVCFLSIASILAVATVGCGQKGSVPAKDVAQTGNAETEAAITLSDAAKNHLTDGKDVIGISMPAQHLERWNRDGSYLKKNFEAAGYQVELAFADNKIDTQISNIHTLIQQGIDVLLLAAVDGTTLSGVLKEAELAKVPVIAYDRITESPSIEYYVSFDNYMVGQLQGEYIRDMLDLDHANGKSYNLEIVSGYSADKNADGYYYGAHDVLEPYIQSGVLNIPSGQEGYRETETFQWSTDYANERMINLLVAYYSNGRRLDAVLCANDSAALGVARAIRTDYEGDNAVLLTGQDGDEANLKNIINGRQSMTVYKCLVNETKAAYDLTIALLEGKEIGENLIQDCGWSFDCVFDDERYSNGEKPMKSFLLTPVTVTRENLQKELIDTGYYKIGKNGYPKAVK